MPINNERVISKRFGMELGGKTSMIIFEDADIDAALPVLKKAQTVFSGQFCMTGSRLLVQDGIYDAVRDGVADRLRKDSGGDLRASADDPALNRGGRSNRSR